ncbi:hypothetical protein K456DRAFT_1295556 [Colletotrichum gloeosporioides 23]|nr:hypothetical protein K456DRAFT_1295556 [Colletotrichum gloeosporioides 23]
MAIWRTNEGFRQNSIHLTSLSFAHCPLCDSRRRRPRRQAVTGLQQTPNSRVQRPCPLSCPATGPASIDRPNDSLSRSTSKHQPLRPQPRSHRDTFHLTCKTTVPTCARHRDRHTAHTAVLTPALYHILWPEVHHVWPFPGAKLSPEPRSLGSHRLPTTYTYIVQHPLYYLCSTLHTFLSAAPCCQTFVVALTSQIHRTCFHYCFWPSLRYRPHGTPSP